MSVKDSLSQSSYVPSTSCIRITKLLTKLFANLKEFLKQEEVGDQGVNEKRKQLMDML